MSEKTFEYCALTYLNLWLEHDRPNFEALNHELKAKKLAALQRAGSFYRVARNLPKKFDEGVDKQRYQPVLEILETVHKEDFTDNPVREIMNIAGLISKEYGNKGVLSLTTKFLWLKIRDPILIYDSQAQRALGTKKHGDLEDYYSRWRSKFTEKREEISEACSKLPQVYKFSSDKTIGTPDYIHSISAQRWFHERVLDLYLWDKGKAQ